MLNKKNAPFGLADLPGAEENSNRSNFTHAFFRTQLKSEACLRSCLQCNRLNHCAGDTGFCTVLRAYRSFLFILLPCSCGGFVSRQHEEVLA